ncbi:uncharacterized protein LOC110714873 [Chenopodium quinoa]|uniref:Uncharacterized protein n=1 Tax=Chenopodium quinoa TaxID=63459 RepID=A0A803LZD1_CHEQI|nr:uncharacterized protein LOC110714873 [Chenopodium quinoa]
MKAQLCMFRTLFTVQSIKFDFCNYFRNTSPCVKAGFFSTTTKSSSRSSPLVGEGVQEVITFVQFPKCATEVLRNYGCSESQISTIFSRQPSLRNAIPSLLESKLYLLRKLGVSSSELVSMVHCRPRLLRCQINRRFDERLNDLLSLFESRALCVRAIIRNPSLLIYDFHKTVIPTFSVYEKMGLSKSEVISMLLLRPTLTQRTNMSPEKLDYIRRTGICSDSKMYKYVVTIIGVSRFETIREKVANLEKYGFSEDEVLAFIGRQPLLMTLSVEKVRRHMTFIMGTMKLPQSIICRYPFLLFCSLETILRPRVLLVSKMREMGLGPQVNQAVMITALRMSEKRFLKKFVGCQEEEVRKELLLYYGASKGIKRLAESSKKTSYTSGFPF